MIHSLSDRVYKAKTLASSGVQGTLLPVAITSWQIDGKTMETVTDFIFWAPKSLQMVTTAMKLKDAYSLQPR